MYWAGWGGEEGVAPREQESRRAYPGGLLCICRAWCFDCEVKGERRRHTRGMLMLGEGSSWSHCPEKEY